MLSTPALSFANPFAACPHLVHGSTYMNGSDGAPRYRTRPDTPVAHADAAAHAAFEARVLAPDYPCVMARSIVNRSSLRFARFGALGDPGHSAQLCHDLYEFAAEFPAPVVGAVSFVACFPGREFDDEAAFEAALWRELQAAHELDARYFPWSDQVASAPSDPTFSYSIGGRAFFIVGMHPGASRLARRMPCPTVVFNLHEQFVELRENGKYDGIRDKIRARDLALQGSPNPMSTDFGDRSEAAQYSGRATPAGWRCPFAAQVAASR